MRRTLLAVVVVAIGLCWLAEPAQAGPRKVFLNGVDLDGVELPAAEFKRCTVKIDDKGNVHITAPGVTLKPEKEHDAPRTRAPASRPAATPARLRADPNPRARRTPERTPRRSYVPAHRPPPDARADRYRLSRR